MIKNVYNDIKNRFEKKTKIYVKIFKMIVFCIPCIRILKSISTVQHKCSLIRRKIYWPISHTTMARYCTNSITPIG